MDGKGAPRERVCNVNRLRGRESRLSPWGTHREKRKTQQTDLHFIHSLGESQCTIPRKVVKWLKASLPLTTPAKSRLDLNI